MAKNLAPILLGGAALFMVAKGKKKKKKRAAPSARPSGMPKPPPPEKVEALPKHAPGPSDKKAGKTVWKKRQEALEDLGYDVGPKGADGRYGKDTKAAIKKFQHDAGIAIDGVWGPITDSAIAQSLIRLAQGIADAVTPAIGSTIDSLLGAAGAVREWGESWLGADETPSGEVVREGAYEASEFRVREVNGRFIGEYRVKGQSGYMKADEGANFDLVWDRTSDAARAASDMALAQQQQQGTAPAGTPGSQWGPGDHIVFDANCSDYPLHLSDEFLYQIQPRLIVEYALEDMTSSEDAEEIHQRLVAEYAPRCASLGRSGIGDGARRWWDKNIHHIYTKLQSYANNPNFLEEDAEKYGL